MDPATPIVARKNLYILKNWLKKLIDGEASDEYGLVIKPKFVEDETVCLPKIVDHGSLVAG
jgi:hypothetical protein